MSQTRPLEEEPIECWDDDDELQFNDGIQFRAASSTGSVTNSSFRPSGHRDSISSRRSARSDLESNVGDEDWQVPLNENDDFAREEALASAKTAGIPIPANIPNSALTGGAIKRLSNRKPKKTFVDDWSDDVELPGPDTVLQLKTAQDTIFPESIRQTSSTVTSPVKSTASPGWSEDISTRLQPKLTTLDQFQDENEDPFGHDIPTIKIPTPRSPQKPNDRLFGTNLDADADGFDQDLELPPDHQPLQLSRREDTVGLSSPVLEDFDLEWSEGSIGVRVGGTARDGRSIPSSSISIASPSVSSCITGGSEEDGLDGLVFPEGPLDLTTSLKKRQETPTAHESTKEAEDHGVPTSTDADDFFSGIEVDNGKAFASGKLSLNPNVKCKTEWPTSPARRSATTLTFTNATGSPRTRIPRLSGHDRTISTQLETVSESGAPLSKFRRSQSRLGHSAQSSISSLPATGPHSISPTPPASTRRFLGSRFPKDAAGPSGVEPSAPGRQLRTKRSLPGIRGITSASVQTSQQPPSGLDGPTSSSFSRPKTPVERTIAESRSSGRRVPAPFIPAGASERQSHHASVKSYRSSRRTNSGNSGDLLSPPGTISRLSRSARPEPLRLSLGDTNTGNTGSTSKRTLTRPTKRRNFGDGTELESFDDLPTSASTESRFVKNPTGRGAPRSIRTRLSQSRTIPPDESHESPPPSSSPPSTSKATHSTPRFARDTNASRNAREQRIASMNSRIREANPLAPFNSNSNWKAPLSRISPTAAPVRSRKPKPGRKSASKPHLIKPMGSGVQEAKCKFPHSTTHFWMPSPPVPCVTDCLTVSSRERHAVQPSYFPLGRERKPRAGLRHCNCPQVTEARARSHRQCGRGAQCPDRGRHDFRPPADVLVEGPGRSAGGTARGGGCVCGTGRPGRQSCS